MIKGSFSSDLTTVRLLHRFLRLDHGILGEDMIVKQWKSQMKLEKEQLGKIPNWVPFYNVPLEYWTEEGLNYISSAVGKPLYAYADSMTESCARLSFARKCVEVGIDLHFANERYAKVLVKYHIRPLKCASCMVFGHSEAQCGVNGEPNGDQVVRTKKKQPSLGERLLFLT